jgi:archaeal flagellar protein FlaI
MIINTRAKIPEIHNIEDKTKINLRYGLLTPFAYVHIFWDLQKQELVYHLEEPILNENKKESLIKLEKIIREMVNFSSAPQTEENQDYIKQLLDKAIKDSNIKLDPVSTDKLFYYIYRDFVGLNEIEPLMHDYFIEDIECNGINQPVYIVHRIFRNLKTNIVFKDVEKQASFVEKLAQKAGRYVSYADPLLDGTLPDGSRVNATYTKDVSSRGPTFTIRKFTKIPWTPINLIKMRTASPEMLAYLWLLMQYKMNVLVAGGTGSGKTTLLNAIAFFIPPEARVVSIEDTRELNLPRENWLPSVVREGVSSGVGEVDMFSLLKASFRQIPDYVIVGEVRGKEASVLFQGMASGHSSLGTIHADSLEAVIRRLETPPIELSPSLVNELDAIAIMTHARIGTRETRKLKEIVEVVNVKADGTAQSNIPLIWDPSKDKFYFKKEMGVFSKIEKRNGIPVDKLLNELENRTKLLNELSKRNIVDVESVQKVLNDYLRDPAPILTKFGI